MINVARVLIYTTGEVWTVNAKPGTAWQNGARMTHVSKLNLVDISWPISILKCSQRVDMMVPGEQLVVSLKNTDTLDSLVTLLETMPDFDYDVRQADGCFLLTVVRYPEPRVGPG